MTTDISGIDVEMDEQPKAQPPQLLVGDAKRDDLENQFAQEARTANQQLRRLWVTSIVSWVVLLCAIAALSWAVVSTQREANSTSAATDASNESTDMGVIVQLDTDILDDGDVPDLYPELADGEYWALIGSVPREQVVDNYVSKKARIMIDIGAMVEVQNFDVSMDQNRYPTGPFDPLQPFAIVGFLLPMSQPDAIFGVSCDSPSDAVCVVHRVYKTHPED